jgi:ribosomal-protein-alanine N-acetyltransferase
MTGFLRRAEAAQADALAAIHATAFPAEESWSSTVIALQLGMPGAFGLLDTRGGMILARVAADEAEVVTLAVVPSQRRRGVGTALLRDAMDHAHRQGAAAMFLEVDIGNLAAQSLYRRLGFVQVGRRPRYYASGADALILRAGLPAATSLGGAATK